MRPLQQHVLRTMKTQPQHDWTITEIREHIGYQRPVMRSALVSLVIAGLVESGAGTGYNGQQKTYRLCAAPAPVHVPCTAVEIEHEVMA